jgi:peptide/nickel transport system permease protein
VSWLARRVLIALVQIWIVATIVFLAIRLVPGNPAELLLSNGGVSPDPVAVATLQEQLGLDRPVLAQYASKFAGLLRGNLGRSLQDDEPVSAEILRRLPRTLELILFAAAIGLALGIPAGTLAAVRVGGPFDRATSAFVSLVLASPVFVLGAILALVFAQWLRWLPAGGYVPFSQSPTRHLTLMIMPSLTIGLGLAAVVFRMTRASVLEVIGRDFVRTARAKGVGPGVALRRHVLRNALLPVVTVVALQLGNLFGGTVLIEYVFNYPGLSGMLVNSVNARDYPSVEGVILVISIMFVLLLLAVDLAYILLDPRVKRR